MAQLPVLKTHLAKVQDMTRRAPSAAAEAMAPLVAEGQERQQAPTGEAFAAVKPYAKNRTGRFDPSRHIAQSYKPVVDGAQAAVVSNHPGASFARHGTKRQAARPLVPRDDSAQRRNAHGQFIPSSSRIGWWLPKITAAMRRLFGGQ